MIPELATIGVIVLASGAELLHAHRCRCLAVLAFGPAARPSGWARVAPVLRVVSMAALCWGMYTLFVIDPKVHSGGNEEPETSQEPARHLLIALDVSPSMRLQDGGPTGKQSRMERAADLLDSLFSRIRISAQRVSVVAFYNGAKPVVVDTRDMAVIRNILCDLPMHYAFEAGRTDLFSGLREVVKIARPWEPKSTTVVVLSDGDTIPATGMPTMPAAVESVLVVGVGDSKSGSFIDGHQSRQDTSTLRQLAARLHGKYHNGNQKHLPSDLLSAFQNGEGDSRLEQLTRREYAIIAVVLGGVVYALLPLLLHSFGTTWKPGVLPGRPARRDRGSLGAGATQREPAFAGGQMRDEVDPLWRR